MKYRNINAELGRVCRNCLNEQYHLGLSSKHCSYMMYPSVCSRCGEVKNIVVSINFFKRLMIRLKMFKSNR